MNGENDRGLEDRLTRLGEAVEPGEAIVADVMRRIQQMAMEPTPAAYLVRRWIVRSGLAAACLLLAVAGWRSFRADETQVAATGNEAETQTRTVLADAGPEVGTPPAQDAEHRYAKLPSDQRLPVDVTDRTNNLIVAIPGKLDVQDGNMGREDIRALLLKEAETSVAANWHDMFDFAVPMDPVADNTPMMSDPLVGYGYVLVPASQAAGALRAVPASQAADAMQRIQAAVHRLDTDPAARDRVARGLPLVVGDIVIDGHFWLPLQEGQPIPAEQAVPRTTRGTVAYWRFDGGQMDSAATGGGSLIDAVGGFRGAPFGEPVYRSVDGRVGLDFDGIDDQVFVPDHPAFAMTKSFTLEAVIRYDGVSQGAVYRNCIIFRGDDRGGFDPYYLSVTRGGQLCLHIANSRSDFVQVVTPAPEPLPKGKWIHVAGTLDDAIGTLRLYVDGKEVAAACTTLRPLGSLDSSYGPGIGIGGLQSAKPDPSWKMYFDGMIAEVRISDFARRPEEFLPFAGDRIVEADPHKIEVYFDRKGFEARLGGPVRVVSFDDIETTKDQPVAFSADHYEKDAGIIIKGTDGQYVGQTFHFPEQFVASSPPNMYAPGPIADREAKPPGGGHETDVTFSAGGKSAAVAGFGTFFIDADLPDSGPSSLAVYDCEGKLLAEEKGFTTVNGGRAFVGMVAVDADGKPVPIVSRVHLTSGACWPAVTDGEGVTLDDFLFSTPAPR